MANSGKKGPYVQTDRFGQPYQVIGCKENKGGYPVGYVELGGHLYKLEPSTAQGEGKYVMWCKVTKVKKRSSHNGSM